MVIISKRNRRTVYEYLLKEGVIVVKKDFKLPEHKDTKIPNLQVWMLLKSLKSRDYVEVIYNWHHYYYYLKNEGVKFLRQSLGITEEVIPITYVKTQKNYYGADERDGEDRPRRGGRGGRGGFRGGRGGRGGRTGGYRRGGDQTEGGETQQPQDAPAETQQ
mmetsp:Transcript_49045/g.68157  ORF Transcript_49045/g.68157 Transcript_49045/m.68157 type:complete len:161 (+) Transcript_49045:131-613(+)